MEFATTADYRAKYDAALDDDRLAVWLSDASAVIEYEMGHAGVDPEQAEEVTLALARGICCDMVHRAVGDGSEAALSIPDGASQASMAAGGYSISYTLPSSGSLYLRDSERVRLGISRGGVGIAVPSFGCAEVPS